MAIPIGELVGRILERSAYMAALQAILDECPKPERVGMVVTHWRDKGVVTDEEAALLMQHNALQSA